MALFFAPFGFFPEGNANLDINDNNGDEDENAESGNWFQLDEDGEEYELIEYPMSPSLPFVLLFLSLDTTALFFLPLLLPAIVVPGSDYDVIHLLNSLSASTKHGIYMICLILLPNIITIVDKDGNETKANKADRYEATSQEEHFIDYFHWTGTFFFFLMFYIVPQFWSEICSFLLTSSFIQQYYPDNFVAWATTYNLVPETPAIGALPTSKKVLDGLPNHILEGNVNTSCAVCLETFLTGDTVKILPCKHYFHPACVLPWLEKHCTCPSCRYELPTDDALYEKIRSISRNTVNSS